MSAPRKSELEANLTANVRLAWGQRAPHARMFRNHVGVAWHGEVIDQGPGFVTLAKPRKVTTGLEVGSGDFIGWTTLVITPDMVGKTVAVFTSGELKRSDVKKAREKQETWHRNVHAAGGFTALVRSVEDALRLVRAWR